MAKVMYGGGVSQMSGSQAGTVHSRNRGGFYTRNRVSPLNPNSATQVMVRSQISDLSTQWSTVLTQAQRDAWTALAAAFPTTDVLGQVIVLTGLQMFVRQNTPLGYAGESYLLDAPINLDVTSLTSLAATVDVSASTMLIDFAPGPVPAGHDLQVYATPLLSPGVSYVKNKVRIISTLTAATATPVDVKDDWAAMFGTLPAAGQKIVFQARLLSLVTGTPSGVLQAEAIAVP